MTLPTTLPELMAMGKALLEPCVRLYCEAFGIGPWDITARWADDLDGNVGRCCPDPDYQFATIEVLWPPVGDVEVTIAHEVAHCYTAELAKLAGAEPGTWARAAWERVAEQTARGAVALRRRGERVSSYVSQRLTAMRSRAIATAKRTTMLEPSVLAAIAVEGGGFTTREDVPEDVKTWILKAVEAMAGGAGEGEAPPPVGEPDPAMGPGAEQEEEKPPPQYMRQMEDRLARLEAARAPATVAPPVATSTDDLRQRQILTRTILAASRGVLSPEAEREFVASGDHDGAERTINEVRRHLALANRAPGSGATPAKPAARLPMLTPAQQRGAARHRVAPERFAEIQQQRRTAPGRKV